MESCLNQGKQAPPVRGLKQVKVDNWGTFFLQRLQKLYYEEELLDLTIKFPTSDITVQAHRLVITTCTDYFMQLERQQREKNENFDGVLIMPPDMPYECVKSIISFMYTGQLEYWTSEQNALYRTAQKMEMTVLTKLLDAQFNTSALQTSPQVPSEINVQPVIVQQKNPSPPKKVAPSLPPQPLPGRKLPIWKRKLDENFEPGNYHGSRQKARETPGPSRFDLPEVDDFALGVFSSFDDITYNTKPIVQAPDNTGNTSGANADGGDGERSRKNEMSDDEDEEMRNSEARISDDKWENSEDEWIGPKPILRNQDMQPSPSKRVRFELEEKENMEKRKNEANPEEAITNHAKIIREVLKKYPHLVKNNKNIRLKIMQKESKSSELSGPTRTKVSYVVLKSDHLITNSASGAQDKKGNTSPDGGERGPWKCNKCDLDEQYPNYYMYRRHMQDVHEEKFDSRVCEHCGYKATKRNILMYHLYTKHNVSPPKSMHFPKCHACSYVALSQMLLVRHQINHDHRPASRISQQQQHMSEEVQCLTCSQTFKDVTELASHEINTGHGNTESKEKGNRCPHCHKVFVRLTNLQVHVDCAHKDIRDAEREANVQNSTPMTLEPSSEAEALSHVASGIAASLGVDCDSMAADGHHEIHTEEMVQYPICNSAIQLNNMVDDGGTLNGHELVEGQEMIMLIDGQAYQAQHIDHHHADQQMVQQHQQTQEHHHQVQPHQLEITGDEQIVMQGTDEGMIVYIHGSDPGGHDRHQTYHETYQTVEIGPHGSEEIVEEVEEVVEEVEEELVEEDDGNIVVSEQQIIGDSNGDETQQIEEVIQYVEEETEIVEYDDKDNTPQTNGEQAHESMMIIEEEEEEEESVEHRPAVTSVEQTERSDLAAEWDDDSADVAES